MHSRRELASKLVGLVFRLLKCSRRGKEELSKTQTQFYGGLNQDEMDPQNQTDSMFYKSNSNMDFKLQIEKLEKKK